MIKAITTAYTMLSKHGFADIMQNSGTGEKSLHASAFFDKEEVVCSFTAAETLAEPTYLTVQIDEHKHITLQPDFLQYINHSCSPNVFFDTTKLELVAVKEIQPGDELLFFYPSTEWNMAQPFECYCNSGDCLHHIKGAAYLTEREIAHYRLTQFIHQQLAKRTQP